MLTAFFESIKYVGHLYPIALLRIYIGYFWFNEGLIKYKNDLFASQLYIEDLKSQDFIHRFPDIYQFFFDNVVAPYWAIWSHGFIFTEMVVGIGLMIGFLTRPLGVIAIIMCLHYSFLGSELVSMLYSTYTAILVTLIVAGAGRCVGFDYYFFKRNRGFLW